MKKVFLFFAAAFFSSVAFGQETLLVNEEFVRDAAALVERAAEAAAESGLSSPSGSNNDSSPSDSNNDSSPSDSDSDSSGD